MDSYFGVENPLSKTDDMMIHSIRYATFILLTMLVSSCSDKESEQPVGERIPVRFRVGFNVDANSTRASTIDNVWTAGREHIAVKNVVTNKICEYTPSSELTNEGAVYLNIVNEADYYFWPKVNPNWSFTGWYPYGGTAAPTTLSVDADQRVRTGSDGITDETYWGYDKLYAPSVTASFLSVVPLVFYHQLARVVVNVNSSYTEDKEAVLSVDFGSDNIGLIGTITTLGSTGSGGTEVWGSVSGSNTIHMRKTSSATSEASNVYTFECLLPPQSGGNDTTPLLTITTDAASENVYLYKTAYNLVAGYQYNYEMAISAQGLITITSVSVNNWDATTVNVSNTATIPGNNYPPLPSTD